MKIRLSSDSIRLRLSGADLEQFRVSGQLVEAVVFGPELHEKFVYALVQEGGTDKVSASLSPNSLVVAIPRSTADAWINTDQVGITAEQSISGGQPLKISVEKDLKDR